MAGSRASYAQPRNEAAIKRKHASSADFPAPGPSSADWRHKKLIAIRERGAGDLVREYHKAQENLLTARLNEEKQIQELTTNRRAGLIGETARVRGAQRVAEQVFAM